MQFYLFIKCFLFLQNISFEMKYKKKNLSPLLEIGEKREKLFE